MARLMIVVVLYRQRWQESPLLPILEDFLATQEARVLLYDNSPQPQQHPFFDLPHVLYHHDATNPGLASAYNFAFAQMRKTGCDRLLLLDQDTQLTKSYIEEVATFSFTDEIPVVVPRLFSGQRQLSPLAAGDYIDRYSKPIGSGVQYQRVMAVNSGCGIALAYLEEIGGFNEAFPLDFLDHWFFWRLFQAGKAVAVSQEKMTHDLSVLHYQRVSTSRYQSILAGETLFYQQYDRELLPRHRQQLLRRWMKQFLTVKNRQIWRLTWQAYRQLKEEQP